MAAHLLVRSDEPVLVVHHDPIVVFVLAAESKGDLHPFALRENTSRKKETTSPRGGVGEMHEFHRKKRSTPERLQDGAAHAAFLSMPPPFLGRKTALGLPTTTSCTQPAIR